MVLQTGGEGEKGEATSKSEPSVLKYHCVTSDASHLFFFFFPLLWSGAHFTLAPPRGVCTRPHERN